MDSRLLAVMSVWPGITPWNVWLLTYGQWRAVAESIDTMRANAPNKPKGGRR